MPEEPEKKIALVPKKRLSRRLKAGLLGVLLIVVLSIVGFVITRPDMINCDIPIVDRGPFDTTDATSQAVKSPEQCLQLETVSTPEQLQQGLSGRPSLDQNQGMLFDFSRAGEQCMWMKDMKFAIDIIWLNAEKKVVDVEEVVRPETYPDSFCSDEDATYVIEVNAGVARKIGATKGNQLQF